MTASLPADDRRPIPTVAIIGNDAVLAAAPATPVQLAHACLRRGFTVAVPVTWGDELLAAEAVRRLSSRDRGPAVMCVCPFVRSRLLAPGPDLAPFLVSLVPPPVATARYLRTVYGDRGVHITYIGACPGADDHAIDARLTPDTFLGELAEHGISLAEQPLVFDSIVPPDRRRWCSLPGGVPSAEVLWSDTDTRTLVEIERDDVSTDLAQHIIARDHVLLDLAPSLGCSCSGAIPSLTPRSARVAVTALEPPRALGPVIEPTTIIQLDAPVGGPPVVHAPPAIVARTHQEIDYDARERALDMILGGEPEPSASPPVVAIPPRRRATTRTEFAVPAPPAPRPADAVGVEPPFMRAEQPRPAVAQTPVLLETLIDDIIIEPLIIPDTRSVSHEPTVTVHEPPHERAPVKAPSEVVVELDVVHDVVAETGSMGVRYENGSTPALTPPADPPEPRATASVITIAVDPPVIADTPMSLGEESRASDAETMVEIPSAADGPLDVSIPSDDAKGADDDSIDASTTARRRTPPAMPSRHPASTIPKAVSADGRPLPRAYVAKRRVTPTGNAAVPSPHPNDAVRELEPVTAAAASSLPAVETAPEAIDPGPQQDQPVSAAPPEVQTPAATEIHVMHTDAEPVAAPNAEAEPPPSESVWGVTVEAPIVQTPGGAERGELTDARPMRLASSRADIPSETPPEPRSTSVVTPATSSNALMTIMVIALVTLAVAVFVLLRR